MKVLLGYLSVLLLTATVSAHAAISSPVLSCAQFLSSASSQEFTVDLGVRVYQEAWSLLEEELSYGEYHDLLLGFQVSDQDEIQDLDRQLKNLFLRGKRIRKVISLYPKLNTLFERFYNKVTETAPHKQEELMSHLVGWIELKIRESARESQEKRKITEERVDLVSPLIELVHGERVVSVVMSSDDSRVLTASEDGTAKIWDAKTGKGITTLRHKRLVRSAQFSLDDSFVVTTSAGFFGAQVWKAQTGEEIATLRGHSREVRSAQFSPDGSRVVTASDDRTARVWDAKTGREISCLRGHTNYLKSAQFSPDGSRVLTYAGDGTARIWDAKTGEEVFNFDHNDEGVVNVGQFSPDGLKVLTASAGGVVRVWNAETGEELLEIGNHNQAVLSAQFSLDGLKVITATADQTAVIWDALTGGEMTRLEGHLHHSRSAQFSFDDLNAVMTSDGFSVRILDGETGAQMTTLQIGRKTYFAQFLSNKSRVVALSTGKIVRIWNWQAWIEEGLLQ